MKFYCHTTLSHLVDRKYLGDFPLSVATKMLRHDYNIFLGSASSLFSEDLARACSEAVEDVVNDHYNRLE